MSGGQTSDYLAIARVSRIDGALGIDLEAFQNFASAIRKLLRIEKDGG
jgi:hypothetical protein